MMTGDKVVCIDDTFSPAIASLYLELPKKDQVYVVRGSTVGVGYGPDGRTEGEICLYLVGLKNPRSNKSPYLERGFNAIRFRLLDELKQESATITEVDCPVHLL